MRDHQSAQVGDAFAQHQLAVFVRVAGNHVARQIVFERKSARS